MNLSVCSVDKPNILIFLADDLGYGDCGAFNQNSKVKTPHIDKLAKEGMSFTDAHSASVTCTPSRYGLLTGINPMRTGVFNTLLKKGEPIIAENELTLGNLLKDQGYFTAMIGKWHLGFEGGKESLLPDQELAGGPADRGFDYFYGLSSSASTSPLCFIENKQFTGKAEKLLQTDKYSGAGKKSQYKIKTSKDLTLEDVGPQLCNKAVDFIKSYEKSGKDKPFFLYFASTLPHQPWVPSSKFKGKSSLGIYGDFLMQIDDEMGQINQALKDAGLAENTLLIFTSDNGTGPGAHYLMAKHGHQSSEKLRGFKASAYEGGHRVPFIAKWPGRITPATQNSSLINGTDFFATFAEILEVNLKEKYPNTAPDSFSFYRSLIDENHDQPRPPMIVRISVRMGDWKLISTRGKKEFNSLQTSDFELYNLKSDIGEKNNLARSNPERLQEMYKELKKFMAQRNLK